MMVADDNRDKPPVVVTQAALRKIEARLKTRFRAFFRPGERLEIEVEQEPDFVYSQFSVQSRAKSFQLQLEAAVIVQDQESHFISSTTSHQRLLAAIEFLSEQLDEYFRSQRNRRFHVDWRLYTTDSFTVRFRGRQRHPDLEERATELLEEEDDFR